MAVYKYYSLIHKEDNAFIVNFPDLDGCYTDGRTLGEAIEMAEDVLGGWLLLSEKQGEAVPDPSAPDAIAVPDGASLILITVDTDKFKNTSR